MVVFKEALEIVQHQKLAAHEAGHCAAAMLLGLDVESVRAPHYTLEQLERDLEREGEDAAAGEVRFAGRCDPREKALAALAGPLNDGSSYWPPTWPLSLAPLSSDEAQVGSAVRALGLDEAGYAALVREAEDLVESREFKALAVAIGHLLEQRGHLDRSALHKIKTATGGEMHHKFVEAEAVSTTSAGELVAYASTFGNVDKAGDRVMPGAFDGTVARIKAGRTIPLVWGHDVHGSPQNIVGEIYDAEQDHEGLKIHARFDLDDPVGRKAWKLVKDGRIDKLSIGYRIPKGGERRNGRVNELHEVDVHEISLVLMPANDRARVLSVKADASPADVMHQVVVAAMCKADARVRTASGDSLREKAERIIREHAPVHVVEYDA